MRFPHCVKFIGYSKAHNYDEGLAIETEDRTLHIAVTGCTGVGKSTLVHRWGGPEPVQTVMNGKKLSYETTASVQTTVRYLEKEGVGLIQVPISDTPGQEVTKQLKAQDHYSHVCQEKGKEKAPVDAVVMVFDYNAHSTCKSLSDEFKAMLGHFEKLGVGSVDNMTCEVPLYLIGNKVDGKGKGTARKIDKMINEPKKAFGVKKFKGFWETCAKNEDGEPRAFKCDITDLEEFRRVYTTEETTEHVGEKAKKTMTAVGEETTFEDILQTIVDEVVVSKGWKNV